MTLSCASKPSFTRHNFRHCHLGHSLSYQVYLLQYIWRIPLHALPRSIAATFTATLPHLSQSYHTTRRSLFFLHRKTLSGWIVCCVTLSPSSRRNRHSYLQVSFHPRPVRTSRTMARRETR